MTEKHPPLLPCPFCGELPENDKGAYVHCANAECPVCVEAYGTEAVASWNTRAVNGLPEAIAALWVIEKGQYSDYRVVGIYTTKERAERVAQALNADASWDKATVSEWPVDPGYDAINKGRKPFSVIMLKDGNVERIDQVEIDCYNIGDSYSIWERTKAPAYVGKGIPDALMATVWGRNEKHAIKIANERRAQMIASGEWK